MASAGMGRKSLRTSDAVSILERLAAERDKKSTRLSGFLYKICPPVRMQSIAIY